MFENEDHKRHRIAALMKMPLYQKAYSILEIGESIKASIPDEDEGLLDEFVGFIQENSDQILERIALAESGILYDMRMEHATWIRRYAQDLNAHCLGLESFGFKDLEYLNLFKTEIDDFRILFAEWIKTFDPWDYTIDRWGLFNPPGVSYNDKNPDDDIPKDPENPYDD